MAKGTKQPLIKWHVLDATKTMKKGAHDYFRVIGEFREWGDVPFGYVAVEVTNAIVTLFFEGHKWVRADRVPRSII